MAMVRLAEVLGVVLNLAYTWLYLNGTLPLAYLFAASVQWAWPVGMLEAATLPKRACMPSILAWPDTAPGLFGASDWS